MSSRKFCRLCINEVWLGGAEDKQNLINIFPGLNTSLTNYIRLCEECFNNISFVNRVKQTFMENEKDFVNSNYGSFCLRSYCKLCFRFKTPDMVFLNKDNFSSDILKSVIEIALSEIKITNSDIAICGICWSWIKKIYSFKKRCFKMEEYLKAYCLKNNLSVLTDEHLKVIYKENFIKTEKIFDVRDRENTLNKPRTQNNLNIFVQQGYIQGTEKVFGNKCKIDANLQDAGVNFIDIEDNILTSQVDNGINRFKDNENELIYIKISKDETEIYDDDVDDEFDEVADRNAENNNDILIILNDDDNGSDILADELTLEMLYMNESNKSENIFNKSEETEVIFVESAEINRNDEISVNNVTSSRAAINNSINVKKKIVISPEPCESYENTEIVSSNLEVDKSPAAREINLSPGKGNVEVHILPENLSNNSVCNISSKKVAEENRSKFNSTVDAFQDNVKMFHNDKNANIVSGDNENLIVNNEKEIVSSDELLLWDEDCFEIAEERNNMIDNSSADSNIMDTKAVNQRKKSAASQENKVWGCYRCIAKFSEKFKAKKHMLAHEYPRNKHGRFKCRKCPYRSSFKGVLTRHQSLHTEASIKKYFGKKISYFCPYCFDIYSFRENVQAHINEHVNSKLKFQSGDRMQENKKNVQL